MQSFVVFTYGRLVTVTLIPTPLISVILNIDFNFVTIEKRTSHGCSSGV